MYDIIKVIIFKSQLRLKVGISDIISVIAILILILIEFGCY